MQFIRVWNYEEATLLNSFSNHDYPDKGVSKLCLVNELDENMLLVASSNSLTSSRKASSYKSVDLADAELFSAYANIDDGNIRIWKDYTSRGKQKLVTAFASIQGHRPGANGVNAVVDWQQQSGYLVCHCTTMI